MSKAPKPKKPRPLLIGVRVDPELMAAIEVAAEKESRSLSQWAALKLRAAVGLKKK